MCKIRTNRCKYKNKSINCNRNKYRNESINCNRNKYRNDNISCNKNEYRKILNIEHRMDGVVAHYIRITAGTLLMAIAVGRYFDNLHVVAGGVTGIAVILNGYWGIPMWLVNAGINLPLFVMAYKGLKLRMFVRTLVTTTLLTFFLAFTPDICIMTGDYLVDIIIGSVLMGLGLGLVFSANTSSGGTDLAAVLINKKVGYMSMPQIMAVLDGIIVICGMAVFGIEQVIYSVISIYVIAKTSDFVIEGMNREKLIYVISKQYEEVARYIICDVGRGASVINMTGAYTKESQNMIMCVVSAKEMVRIKQNVYKIDKNALCFIGDIREAFGEGFTKFMG